ncbi:NHL repeat-containing protein [Mucilaginibacter gracilis]|uniref:NHL repeat-containing protein n=1 Tax=Mucilaginibacter gracilis TaxID=423350 RepID=A0A495IZT1_9SPHI|nr:NHL repeat-containing protein [Mucilaginibacter gracilis]RKR81618.1 NHL repeat-containing protein [Mucilaginibacter gracilis]
MKQHFTKIVFAFLFSVIVISAGCNKSNSDDNGVLGSALTYSPIGPLTSTTAQFYTVVSGNGNASITEVGVCYSTTNQTPTISDTKKANSLDSVSYVSILTGLKPNTTYYLRGYITDNGGTGYGNVITFKTPTTTYATTATVSTFAGSTSATGGLVNGTGTAAQFNNPVGICTDAQGNMYVADSFNSVIRKITSAGVVTTFAGTGTSGYLDGPAATAQFYSPRGVAVDAQGNVYVADLGNNMIRKITAAGVVSTLAGRYTVGYVNATGTAAAFHSPTGVAVDAQGNVYVADRDNHVIRKVTSAGVVTTLAGYGSPGQLDQTGTAAYFNTPTSLYIDAQGNLYVTDSNNYSIRKVVTSTGVVTTVVGNYVLKTGVFAPSGVCMDTKGDFFISDPTGRVFEITAANVLIQLAGSLNGVGFTDGTNASVLFNSPQGVTTDAAGNVYVTDMYNNVIRKIAITTTP